jgi:hypothetical protein
MQETDMFVIFLLLTFRLWAAEVSETANSEGYAFEKIQWGPVTNGVSAGIQLETNLAGGVKAYLFLKQLPETASSKFWLPRQDQIFSVSLAEGTNLAKAKPARSQIGREISKKETLSTRQNARISFRSTSPVFVNTLQLDRYYDLELGKNYSMDVSVRLLMHVKSNKTLVPIYFPPLKAKFSVPPAGH